ncbi:uncharacterized protein [Dysidea avara]|uniref:uncharacterized protein isoform X2 n=2 Tax=Dysidea avara TaxID=196820 RepID=UPI00332DF5E7
MKKRKSYQTGLYKRRGKYTETDREERMWGELAAVYMTEESEDETTGVIRQHHIPWQSETLREAKEVLDQRYNSSNRRPGQFTSKERVASTPSTTPIPRNPVKWAINGAYLSRSGSARSFGGSPSGVEPPNSHPVMAPHSSTNRTPPGNSVQWRNEQSSTIQRSQYTREEQHRSHSNYESVPRTPQMAIPYDHNRHTHSSGSSTVNRSSTVTPIRSAVSQSNAVTPSRRCRSTPHSTPRSMSSELMFPTFGQHSSSNVQLDSDDTLTSATSSYRLDAGDIPGLLDDDQSA